MLRNLLLCGLVAGLCAGVVGTGFASLAGEPAIDRAIAYEDAHAATIQMHAAEPVPVSRALQKSAGLLTALAVDGVALGGIFALVFAFAYGRLGLASPRATAYWLAAGAFVVLFLVPFVKFPATPPAIGDPATIDRRTTLYAAMFAISVLAAIAAARLRPVLRQRLDGHAATGLAVLAYLAVVIGAGLALPGVNEVPADFPATTLWRFREASVGLQLTMWATIGTLFGFAAQRVMTGRPLLARRRGVDRGAGMAAVD
jgi:predicted cobalt transporter CbtA